VPIAHFCSACGARLAAAPPVTCGACGIEHWRNAKPCANAIVARDARIMLVRRAHAPWRDAWCAPGGFCEPAEHPIATVEREILEETGLTVRVTGFIGIWLCEYADTPDPENDVISVAYYHAKPTGEAHGPIDPTEVSEVGWFAWDELPHGLAPPETLPAVLEAWRADAFAGRSETPLPDRPDGSGHKPVSWPRRRPR
jgi:ADP-ribose pyrophosphatase YjhB (NUDIX family)